MDKVCETHKQWPKHDKHDQLKLNPSQETHLSPIQHKNVTKTFCQAPNMQQSTQMMKNAWT